MDGLRNDDHFPALLTAGSFLATIVTATFGIIDALDGSAWYADEVSLAGLFGMSFVWLVATGERPVEHEVDD